MIPQTTITATDVSEVEREFEQIWKEVLDVVTVDRDDSFFDLGGDSRLGMQMLARVQAKLQVEIPLYALFESPTIAALTQRMGEWAKSAPHSAPLPRGNEERLPLSSAQQRLFVLNQLDPGSTAYSNRYAFRLTGPLNAVALQQSLTRLVERHEPLRTTFPQVEGGPFQQIHPGAMVSLPVTDLSAYPAHQAEEELTRLVAAEIRVPFSLAEGPLFRARLYRLTDQTHVLLLLIHHSVFDGWSLGVLARDLSALYASALSGQPSPLSALPLRYADYTLAERDQVEKASQQQMHYWRKQFAGPLPTLDLSPGHPHPPLADDPGARCSFVLPPVLTEQLGALCREHQVTPFMALFAAFAVLLRRYSGQTDITIGTPVANRPRQELESLIGCFINTLALRVDLSGNPTYLDLLGRVKQLTLDAFAHQEIPFERLVAELSPLRDAGRHPLFQVMFALNNTPSAPLQLTGLRADPVELGGETARFDITLSFEKREHRYQGSVEYRTSQFDRATMERLIGHYLSLLEASVRDPLQHIDVLPLLTEPERQLLESWNDTQVPFPRHRLLHQLFEDQVKRTPDALAVCCEGSSLTYRELNQRSNQLAHLLVARGVGPEVVVGIALERSLELVIAFLGVCKAGGAYLPLDPGYPSERLAYMLHDAGARVLLTETRLLPSLQIQPDCDMVCLDADAEPLSQESLRSPSSAAQPNNLCYLIYTSGSTGLPKGVEITHVSLLNLIFWHQRAFAVTAADRATQIASPAFDAAGWEMWPYLACGATLYIPKEETRLSPEKLRDWLLAQAITITFLPTPLAEQVMALEWPAASPLRYLLTGGDTLRQYPAASLPFTVVNNYGPTEATVVATSGVVEPTRRLLGLPSIGRAIDNTRLVVLDPAGQLVPIGVPGGLFIGGDGLARAYRNRPEETRTRFQADPYSSTPGARLYRTGDRVRWLPDGSLAFLGREDGDGQVKILGRRVEVDEIGVRLLQHPMIQEAIVLAHDAAGEKRLVAYIVPRGQQPLSNDLLRRYLQESLPAYMIPSTYFTLPSLPLTPNGKIDRHRLPVPECEPAPDVFVAPRTATEEQLAAIVSRELHINRVSVDANFFFELGGHSMAAVRVLTQVQTHFHVALPLSSFFEWPTVAGLSRAIVLHQAREIDDPQVLQLLDEIEQLPDDEVQHALTQQQGEGRIA